MNIGGGVASKSHIPWKTALTCDNISGGVFDIALTKQKNKKFVGYDFKVKTK